MQISVEWFLVDNLLMNWLIMRLASALCGLPLRKYLGFIIALLGAVCALISVVWLPSFSLPMPKLLLGCMMAIPLMHHRNDVIRAVLFLYLSACLIGGLMLCLCVVLGGSMLQGVLIGTLPIRAALIGGVLSAMLPKMIRRLIERVNRRAQFVPLRIQYGGQTIQMTALIDSGNLLIEPLSAKPVIVVRKGLFGSSVQTGRPVAFQSVGGEGYLLAVQAERIGVFWKRWHAVDAYFAESPGLIADADAILPATLLPKERNEYCATTNKEDGFKAVLQIILSIISKAADTIHSFGGNASCAISAGGGTGVDQTLDDGGTGSKECADRT